MLLSFVGRLGQLLIAPRDGLRRVEAQGGGFRDMLVLVVLGTICLRFPQLAEAALGLSQPSWGAFLRVVSVFSNEAVEAAAVVTAATVTIIALAGARRNPNLDLELGAACFAPFFFGRAITRVVSAAGGHATPARLASAIVYAPGVVWAAWSLFRALQVAWARPAGGVAGTGGGDQAVANPDAATSAPATGDSPTSTPSAPATSLAPTAGARRAGLVALALLVMGLGFNAGWANRHVDALRPLEIGSPAPAIDLPRIDGTSGQLSLSALRGKVVLLDFWATWCPPCIQMIPVLHDLHHEWSPRGLEIVGVSSDGDQASPQEIRAFLQSRPSPYPMVLDDGTANTLYKIRALPEMVLIDREGVVRNVFIGYTSRRTLAAAFADALGTGANP